MSHGPAKTLSFKLLNQKAVANGKNPGQGAGHYKKNRDGHGKMVPLHGLFKGLLIHGDLAPQDQHIVARIRCQAGPAFLHLFTFLTAGRCQSAPVKKPPFVEPLPFIRRQMYRRRRPRGRDDPSFPFLKNNIPQLGPVHEIFQHLSDGRVSKRAKRRQPAERTFDVMIKFCCNLTVSSLSEPMDMSRRGSEPPGKPHHG